MRKYILWFFIPFLLTSVLAEGQRRQLHYWPAKVQLTGKLVHRTFYGPPGYGENPKTDSRETQAILILHSPVDVIATENDDLNGTERAIKAITLVPEVSIGRFLGKRVTVAGTLFHAITGHHHTKVLMTVSSIKRAR